MTITVELVVDQGYILVGHEGVITIPEIDESRPKILGLVASSGIMRVFVDVRGASNRLTTIEYFSSTESYVKEGFPRPRCAMVCRADQLADLTFIESVAVNRGLPLKVFLSQEEALEWLLH